MEERLFGVPFVVWGGLCLAVSVVWTVVWPKDKVAVGETLRFIILRWFHALVWVLLAIAAFIAAFNILGGTSTAHLVALLSLAVYLVFMFTFATSKP